MNVNYFVSIRWRTKTIPNNLSVLFFSLQLWLKRLFPASVLQYSSVCFYILNTFCCYRFFCEDFCFFFRFSWIFQLIFPYFNILVLLMPFPKNFFKMFGNKASFNSIQFNSFKFLGETVSNWRCYHWCTSSNELCVFFSPVHSVHNNTLFNLWCAEKKH